MNINNIKFEAFEETGAKFGRGSLVSIHSKGALAFNTTMVKEFDLKDYKFAALRYGEDESHHYIGIYFTNDATTKGALKINFTQSHYGMIAAVSYFKKYQIDYASKKGSYSVALHEDKKLGKMYVLTVPK